MEKTPKEVLSKANLGEAKAFLRKALGNITKEKKIEIEKILSEQYGSKGMAIALTLINKVEAKLESKSREDKVQALLTFLMNALIMLTLSEDITLTPKIDLVS